jgi:hypothetical protein
MASLLPSHPAYLIVPVAYNQVAVPVEAPIGEPADPVKEAEL